VVGREHRGQGRDREQRDPAQLGGVAGGDEGERRDQREHDDARGHRERLDAPGDPG
jgi:hypothetical protein